jgi:transposase
VPGKYKTYSPEFRDEAARMVVETSRPIADVARELKVSETSLGNWVRAYRIAMDFSVISVCDGVLSEA